MKLKKAMLLFLILGICILMIGCGQGNDGSGPSEDLSAEEPKALPQEEVDEPKEPEEAKEETVLFLPPNEAGQIMILMYHRFGEPEGTWQRTLDNFRKDLEYLYEEGYRLISMDDYLQNRIDVPAGYSPVVLTFDDGYNNQFSIVKDGEQWAMKEDTAVGVMHAFYQEYPDFGLKGTFYINSQPFAGGNWQPAIRMLVQELGLELGNHTRTHINMRDHEPGRIRQELGGLVKDIQEVLPGYAITSLALPYGVAPKSTDVYKGEYDGTAYEMQGVLLVGANPAPSPISKQYDPYRIPRIRGDEENFSKWLNHFRENPHLRYVSDGNLETITVPEDMLDRVDPALAEGSEVVVYESERGSE